MATPLLYVLDKLSQSHSGMQVDKDVYVIGHTVDAEYTTFFVNYDSVDVAVELSLVLEGYG